MTMRFRLSEVDCVTISGADHILKSQGADGIILQRLDARDIFLAFSHAEFVRLRGAPDVSLKRNHFSSPSAARRLQNDQSYLASLAAPARDQILWKEAWVGALLRACRDSEVKRIEASIAAFMPTLTLRVAEIERKSQRPFSPNRVGRVVELRDPPSAKTLLRWLGKYEKLGATPLALLRKKRCASTFRQKFCAEAALLIRKGLAKYLVRGGPKPAQIIDNISDDFKAANAQRALEGKAPLPIPCANSIRAAIKKLDAFEVVAQREGLEVARRKFGFYENGLSAEHPLQRVEIDDWEIDLMSWLGESGALDGLDEDLRAKLGNMHARACSRDGPFAVNCVLPRPKGMAPESVVRLAGPGHRGIDLWTQSITWAGYGARQHEPAEPVGRCIIRRNGAVADGASCLALGADPRSDLAGG